MAVRLAPCLRPAASRNARAVAGSLWAPPDIVHRPFQNKTPAYRFFFFCETKVFFSLVFNENREQF